MVEMVDILSIEPHLGTTHHLKVGDKYTVKLNIKSTIPAKLVKPQMWTNLKHKGSQEADWHYIDMVVAPGNGGITYSATVELNQAGDYEYTVRVGVTKGTGVVDWKWAGGFGENVKVHVQ